MSQDVPTKFHKTSPFPQLPSREQSHGTHRFREVRKIIDSSKVSVLGKKGYVSSFLGGYQTSPQQIPIPNKATTEIPKPNPRSSTTPRLPRSCASDSAWVKIVGSWWFQVSEVDFYFSGGYEKPSNFQGIHELSWVGDEIIVIFRLGWWNFKYFLFLLENFGGNEIQFDIFQMGWKPQLENDFDSSPYQFFMLCYFQSNPPIFVRKIPGFNRSKIRWSTWKPFWNLKADKVKMSKIFLKWIISSTWIIFWLFLLPYFRAVECLLERGSSLKTMKQEFVA